MNILIEVSKLFQGRGLPAISVDTKKRENIGCANKGKEYSKKGQPEEVEVYDFINKELGKKLLPMVFMIFLEMKGLSTLELVAIQQNSQSIQ